jgi:hypothetical protein
MRTRRDGSGAFARRERPIIVEPMGAGLCGITLQIAIGGVVKNSVLERTLTGPAPSPTHRGFFWRAKA